MHITTEIALLDCITHWGENVLSCKALAAGKDSKTPTIGSDHCALCSIFQRPPHTLPGPPYFGDMQCAGCPVCEDSGLPMCDGSPYPQAADSVLYAHRMAEGWTSDDPQELLDMWALAERDCRAMARYLVYLLPYDLMKARV